MLRNLPIIAILALALSAAWLVAPSAADPDDRPPAPPAAEPDRDPDGRDFRDRRFDPRRGDRVRELSAERIDKMMIVIAAYAPEFAVQLRSLRESDPTKFRHLMHRLAPRFEEGVRMLERDPEGFELRVRQTRLNGQIARAVRAYRGAESEDDKQKLRGEIRELIDEQFQLRLEQAEREVVQIEQRLDTLRAEIAERESNREQLVDERLEQVLTAEWRPDPTRRPRHTGDEARDRRPGPPGSSDRPGRGDGPPRRQPPADAPDRP